METTRYRCPKKPVAKMGNEPHTDADGVLIVNAIGHLRTAAAQP